MTRRPIKRHRIQIGESVRIMTGRDHISVTVDAFAEIGGEKIILCRMPHFAGMQNVIVGYPVASIVGVIVPVEDAP
jgi:hypothetical protein